MAAISYYLTEKRSELKVNSLKLKNFRNYDLLNVEFDGSTNIFYGNNAQGKTNILEAVYLSGTTKSHRGSKDRDMIRFGEDESHIETVVEKNGISYQIDMHLKKNSPKGIAIKDDDDLFGPSIIKSTNRNPEEMPESYKLLPPEEQVQGFMEWTFSDESGNATDYPSFDVFVAHSSRSRSVGPAPDLVCLYKDLTEHYKNQYPDAGVKTVVVSFTIDI